MKPRELSRNFCLESSIRTRWSLSIARMARVKNSWSSSRSSKLTLNFKSSSCATASTSKGTTQCSNLLILVSNLSPVALATKTTLTFPNFSNHRKLNHLFSTRRIWQQLLSILSDWRLNPTINHQILKASSICTMTQYIPNLKSQKCKLGKVQRNLEKIHQIHRKLWRRVIHKNCLGLKLSTN